MLRTAVVGVGYLGRFHAQKHRELNGKQVQFVGVCDASAARAEEVAMELGCRAFTNYKELKGQVDAVTIAANTIYHYDIARFFLECGVHVLLEKPIAETIRQAEELCQLASKSNLKFQIGHIERFNPALLSVRPQIKQPHFFRGERLSLFKGRAADVDVVLDVMIHDIDLAVWTVKSRVKSITAVGSSVVTKSADFADAQLIFESGAIAHLTASRAWTDTVRRAEIHDGKHILDLDLGALKVRRIDAATSGAEIKVETLEVAKQDAMMAETVAFLESIEKNQKPVIDGQEGLYALEIAHWVRDEIHRNPF